MICLNRCLDKLLTIFCADTVFFVLSGNKNDQSCKCKLFFFSSCFLTPLQMALKMSLNCCRLLVTNTSKYFSHTDYLFLTFTYRHLSVVQKKYTNNQNFILFFSIGFKNIPFISSSCFMKPAGFSLCR